MHERTVAPCFDCGHAAAELQELAAGEHTYHRYRVFGQEIVLCDFCDADFGSYYPSHFGLPGKTPGEAKYELDLIAPVDHPQPAKDFVCENCKYRLAFLRFLAAARHLNMTRYGG
jgi:hypothetical protein